MATLNDARNQLAEGDLEGARDALVDVLYDDYDNLDAWLLLTECAADQDEYARAIREALRVDPENPIARQLALDMARTSPATSASGEARVRQQTGNAVRSLGNWLIFFIVAGIGAAIAVAVALSGSDSNGGDESRVDNEAVANICAVAAPTAYDRLAARCGLVSDGTVCLANPDVDFEMRPGFAPPVLPGDRVDTVNVVAFSTQRYTETSGAFGLVVLQQLTANNSVQVLVTNGVRLSEIQQIPDTPGFKVSSNPVLGPCNALPPPGALLISESNKTLRINGLDVTINGVAFVQVDAAGGMRIVNLTGEVTLTNTVTSDTVRLLTGQWTRLSVDPTLQAEDSIEPAQIGQAPIRGNLDDIILAASALGIITDNWLVPSGPVEVAIQPTPTATRGIRLQSATPTPTASRTPRSTATLRPTRTPTTTDVPTSTSIPVLEATPDERLPATEVALNANDGSDAVEPTAPAAVQESPLSGTWDCMVTIDNISFSYIITIEPMLVRNRLLASAVIPSVENSVVTLEGNVNDDFTTLDANWTRIPDYQSGDRWILLRENTLLYPPGGTDYAADGTLRLIYNNGTLRGGIFMEERFVGLLSVCERRE